MAIAAQRRAQCRRLRLRGLVEQPGQVGRLLAAGRLRDDLGGDRADPGHLLQVSVSQPPLQFACREV